MSFHLDDYTHLYWLRWDERNALPEGSSLENAGACAEVIKFEDISDKAKREFFGNIREKLSIDTRSELHEQPAAASFVLPLETEGQKEQPLLVVEKEEAALDCPEEFENTDELSFAETTLEQPEITTFSEANISLSSIDFQAADSSDLMKKLCMLKNIITEISSRLVANRSKMKDLLEKQNVDEAYRHLRSDFFSLRATMQHLEAQLGVSFPKVPLEISDTLDMPIPFQFSGKTPHEIALCRRYFQFYFLSIQHLAAMEKKIGAVLEQLKLFYQSPKQFSLEEVQKWEEFAPFCEMYSNILLVLMNNFKTFSPEADAQGSAQHSTLLP